MRAYVCFSFPFTIGKRNWRLSFFNLQFPVTISENGNRTSLSLSVVPMSLQNGIRTSIFVFRLIGISLTFLAMLELSLPWKVLHCNQGRLLSSPYCIMVKQPPLDCNIVACFLRRGPKRRKRDLSRASLTHPRVCLCIRTRFRHFVLRPGSLNARSRTDSRI